MNPTTEAPDTIHASGTSEGVRKAWETRHIGGPSASDIAQDNWQKSMHHIDKALAIREKLSKETDSQKRITLETKANLHKFAGEAYAASSRAHSTGTLEAHAEAERAHKEAWYQHEKVEDYKGALTHAGIAHFHKARGNSSEPTKASDPGSQPDVVHCRDNGLTIESARPWKQGQEVEFMYMPAGQNTICAHFRGKAISLTVNVDPLKAAQVAQASLDQLKASYPKLRPYGCIEHEEKDASVWATEFRAKGDGVYLAAEPSALGEQHVNGKIHRSWSPSFTTDAAYAQASEQDGVFTFPEGVRGSASNPAEITGVAFVVGTLTNKPAFRSINPVAASDPSMNPDTIKAATGAYAPGHEFHGNQYTQEQVGHLTHIKEHLREGEHITYDDGKGQPAKAQVLEKEDRGMHVQFEDRAAPTYMGYGNKAWMAHIKPHNPVKASAASPTADTILARLAPATTKTADSPRAPAPLPTSSAIFARLQASKQALPQPAPK